MPPPQIGLVVQDGWLVQVSTVVVVVEVVVAVHDLHGMGTGTVVVLIWVVVEVKNSLVVVVITSTESVYRVDVEVWTRVVIWVMVIVVRAGHVSDVECDQLGVGVQAGREGVYHSAHVLDGAAHAAPFFVPELLQLFPPPPSFPRSAFLAPSTTLLNNVSRSKIFILQLAALVLRNADGENTEKSATKVQGNKKRPLRDQLLNCINSGGMV